VSDERKRRMSISLDAATGEVLVAVPSGKAGLVRRLVQLNREDARNLARGVLDLVGEDDQ
jgi:hypothetical protein